jgi:hypothetical protein
LFNLNSGKVYRHYLMEARSSPAPMASSARSHQQPITPILKSRPLADVRRA